MCEIRSLLIYLSTHFPDATLYPMHLTCVVCSGALRRAFPKALRLKWLQKMRHSKVKLSLASSVGRVDLGRILGRAASTTDGGNSSSNSGSNSGSGGGRSKPAVAVRPFPTVRGQRSSISSKRRDGGGDEEQEDGKDDVTMHTAPDTDAYGGTVVGGFVEMHCNIL
jgi:hypothetical protein